MHSISKGFGFYDSMGARKEIIIEPYDSGKIWVDTDYVEGACLKFTHPLNMAENNGNDNGSK